MEKKNSEMKVRSNINENKVSLILDLRKNGMNSLKETENKQKI